MNLEEKKYNFIKEFHPNEISIDDLGNYEGYIPKLIRLLAFSIKDNHRYVEMVAKNNWYNEKKWSIFVRFRHCECSDIDILFWWLKNNPKFIDLFIKKELKEEFISLMDKHPEYFELVFDSIMGNQINGCLRDLPYNMRQKMLDEFKLNDPEGYEDYVQWCENPESFKPHDKYYY